MDLIWPRNKPSLKTALLKETMLTILSIGVFILSVRETSFEYTIRTPLNCPRVTAERKVHRIHRINIELAHIYVRYSTQHFQHENAKSHVNDGVIGQNTEYKWCQTNRKEKRILQQWYNKNSTQKICYYDLTSWTVLTNSINNMIFLSTRLFIRWRIKI